MPIKRFEALAFPLISVRFNSRKTFWKCDTELKAKNQTKCWLKVWIAFGTLLKGETSIKTKTKSTNKRHRRTKCIFQDYHGLPR